MLLDIHVEQSDADWRVKLQGHAGTIPMPMRKDPMAAAAEAITWMEQRCGGGSYQGVKPPVAAAENLMCTTGSVGLWPNAFNVVPGQANFTLDVRSKNDEVWKSAIGDTRARIEEICRRRGLACEVQHKNSVNAVHSDEGLLTQLKAAITDSQEVSQPITLSPPPHHEFVATLVEVAQQWDSSSTHTVTA